MFRSRFDNALGRLITRLLADACVTQREAALRLGLSASTFNQFVTGRMTPPADLEARVRRVLRR